METLRPYPGMLPDEDDLEPLDSYELAVEIKPCMSCMAPNEETASRCTACGSVFGTPSVVFPAAPERRYGRQGGAVKPSKIEVVVTCILNLAFFCWNIAAIRNTMTGPVTPFAWLILSVGVIFLVICMRNLYLIFAAYRKLPAYWDGRD